jgi:hypothetical protein
MYVCMYVCMYVGLFFMYVPYLGNIDLLVLSPGAFFKNMFYICVTKLYKSHTTIYFHKLDINL